MSNRLIDGVFTLGSNAFTMKYFAYSDDVTLMMLGTYLVSKALARLLEYEMATGLKISLKKSKGFFCCKDRTPTFNSDELKQLKWRSDFIDNLNIHLVQNKKFLEFFRQKLIPLKMKFYV